MAFTLRQKLTVIPILVYWPAIFILTHIPLPPSLLRGIAASDKTLHFLGYLVLVFLLWFAVSAEAKVNWRRTVVWWVLLVMAVYGVLDEWLQGYVGRSPNIMDFLADLGGALTGLILLSIFPFWLASVALTAGVIFILTNFAQPNPGGMLAVTDAAFHLFAYGLFSLLWIRCMDHLLPIKAPEPKWLVGVLALPIGFLLAVELFSVVAGNGFRPLRVIISTVGIIGAVGDIFLIALFRQRFRGKSARGKA